MDMLYRLLADGVLLLHAAYIGFVVFGLVLVLVGGAMRWRWVRRRRFRLLHLAAIGVVVMQAWLGVDCPLTTLESALRERAGQRVYEQGFIADHVQPLIFFHGEPWMFTLGYTVFGLLVLASLWLVPPTWRPLRRRVSSAAG